MPFFKNLLFRYGFTLFLITMQPASRHARCIIPALTLRSVVIYRRFSDNFLSYRIRDCSYKLIQIQSRYNVFNVEQRGMRIMRNQCVCLSSSTENGEQCWRWIGHVNWAETETETKLMARGVLRAVESTGRIPENRWPRNGTPVSLLFSTRWRF